MQQSIRLSTNDNCHGEIAAMNPNAYISPFKISINKKMVVILKDRLRLTETMKPKVERNLEYLWAGNYSH